MKFNVSSKALYNATSAVSKVINSKNTLAILDNFLINPKVETYSQSPVVTRRTHSLPA